MNNIEIREIATAARHANWTQTEGARTHGTWTRRDQTLKVEFLRTTGKVTYLTYADDFEERPRHETTIQEIRDIIESLEDPWGLDEDPNA